MYSVIYFFDSYRHSETFDSSADALRCALDLLDNSSALSVQIIHNTLHPTKLTLS